MRKEKQDLEFQALSFLIRSNCVFDRQFFALTVVVSA